MEDWWLEVIGQWEYEKHEWQCEWPSKKDWSASTSGQSITAEGGWKRKSGQRTGSKGGTTSQLDR